MGYPVGEWGYGMCARMRSKRLRRRFKVCRKKIRHKWVIVRNRMMRHPGIRQQRRIRFIKELAAVIIFVAAVYTAQTVDSVDFLQITMQDRLPELVGGFLVMLAAVIIYITTEHLENFRKK